MFQNSMCDDNRYWWLVFVICLKKTNKMQFSLFIWQFYPLHVSNRITIHHQEAFTVYEAYTTSHVVHLQGSGGKHNFPENQKPLLWNTFGDSFAWIKEFHSTTLTSSTMLKFFNVVEEVKVVLQRSESCGFGFSLLGTAGLPPVIYDIIENSPAAESGKESAHSQSCCYGILWPKRRYHQRFSIVGVFDLLGCNAWPLTPEDGSHGTYHMLHIQ